ncbi:accessory Sec system translocase SecA2 [Amycolatopsis sp. FDAARGOS 1241]|uniref:accessory Sec system translocase SecA2 n=1 Tax=Amycolatopsis sp. FDAARGOS 1241 TaxID=2778070 RepID=UPI00194E06B9|nr:accessory Sec system translocase SecA2 [Amycolatopsis sp. FDAARGOS 1241]QRP44954.1 accessory Sec system translocase SecA2 [Amycolatopsis sp. FDAARGOS 1241]
MALISRVGKRLRRIIQRPGSVELTRYEALLPAVGKLEPDLEKLSDAELTERAGKLRESLDGAQAFSDDQLVEVGALGREAARRALGERAFDVQVLGTMGLLTGHVVQMETGEGKTLAGALAAAGYALRGKRVHVVTVNDYLARRDAEWMKPVYDLLGVSVGWVEPAHSRAERKEAYGQEVTYGAVAEIGFDVLRDRLVTQVDDLVQPAPEVAIVDEADSVLVDEARVPLVMAGSIDHNDADEEVATVVRRLRLGLHYETDTDGRNAWLTPAGASVVEKSLGGIDLYDDSGSDRLAAVNVALHAHALLTRDVDYLVRDGKVQLINAARGRVAELQRWPDGLQAAVEAKEQVAATDRGEILDSITVQALLARYPSVAGMTGTAVAVAEQLREFYRLEVAVIPPNTPNVREDQPDRIFGSPSQKLRAIEEEIRKVHETGRPILVGTQDVAESEELADKLAKADLPCVVLNARNDAEEAAIIAEAGKKGAVTVSTQMAGRGTDIRLGGTDGAGREEVAELGGLHVIGTARYPSSRLDGQLRGRSGRQGDPGSAIFFASLNDDLVLSNAPDIPEGIDADPETGEITDPAALRQINHAQRVAEGVDLEIHRNTWRYTRLIERQRTELLEHRDKVLHTAFAAEELEKAQPEKFAEVKEKLADTERLEQLSREVLLFHLDQLWSDHLAYLTDVRESIHLRALARETPLDEFHRAAIPEFHKIIPESASRAAKTLEEAEITDNGIDLADAGVRRANTTWTYLVHDNPFDSDFEQTVKKVRSMMRMKRS